jgi:peptide/nickel transport system permease protein
MRLLSIRFVRDLRNWIPLIFVIGFVILALFAPLISPPTDLSDPGFNRNGGFSQTPLSPNPTNPLGTFPGGFDVFHTIIWGARSALQFGLTVALATAAIGIGIGAISNFLGGTPGRIGMRITDAFLAFPSLAAIMLFSQIFKPGSPTGFTQLLNILHLEPVALALILFSWMAYSRLTYVSIEQQKDQEYIEAARVMGLNNVSIFFRHILPNISTPLVVLVMRDIGGMVILEAALGFIGVSHITEWGQMIAASKDWIVGPTLGFTYWWTFIPVTLVLILFSVSWQWLGQRINATVNPRSYSFLK